MSGRLSNFGRSLAERLANELMFEPEFKVKPDPVTTTTGTVLHVLIAAKLHASNAHSFA